MRNSLRLFGLLTVLAGVNVYVFFFNHGTAPREVLKPSSMVKGADSKAATLKEARDDAQAALSPQASGHSGGGASAPADGSRAKPPVVLAPTATGPTGVAKTGVASSGPPKGSPGGSPGQPNAGPPPSTNAQQNGQPGQLPESPESAQSSPEKIIGNADTLGQLLAREGFEGEGVRVTAALSRLFDPKSIRGGQRYTVRLDEKGDPDSFEYRPNAVTRFVATRAPSRTDEGAGVAVRDGVWTARRVDQPVETKVVSLAGSIDSTFYESVQGAGEGSALAGLLVELLAWDVDFYTDTHPGDHWKVIVEKQFLGGQFYRYGHILAAEYGGRVGTFRLFYWKPDRPNAQGRYFDEKGQAISKTMLKTPLRFVRVSSKFDRHRFHPILHREKAHLGVDYAAPVGTPVWASSGGKVQECAAKRGSGNTVVIAHGNGMATRYYHLSRFARGLKAGKVVRQKEVIGFVGTTGLSTGPHLHFSVTKNGAFVDPGKVQVNRDAPVADRAAFLAAVRPRIATLRGLEPGALARN